MKDARTIKNLVKDLRYRIGAEARERVLKNALNGLEEAELDSHRGQAPGRRGKTILLFSAAAAAALLVLLGGGLLRQDGSPGEKWWLQPAWADGVREFLDRVETLVHREQSVSVEKFGTTHTSGSWRKFYTARDRKRIDTYYQERLVGTKWEILAKDGSWTHYDVNHENQCYGIAENQGGPPPGDPVKRIRFYVDLLDRADRVLDEETFEGHRCIGFEISASKYGDNPGDWIDRIWFDVGTRKPVRIERHGRPMTNRPEMTSTTILDQFEYHVQMPADLFEPVIPPGYVNAHPDEIRAERERQEKGDMDFADVPPGLKAGLMAALDGIDTVSYRKNGDRNVYLSRLAWRVDHLAGERLRMSEWFVLERSDPAPTSHDFNDREFRLVHTRVDHENGMYQKVEHGRDTRPGHPMDAIRFLAGQVDRADRMLEDTVVEGIRCSGFELSARKYGTNPDSMVHRMWFDLETKLPVRMEFEYLPGGASKTVVLVEDHFVWNPELPPEFFTPEIPRGYTARE